MVTVTLSLLHKFELYMILFATATLIPAILIIGHDFNFYNSARSDFMQKLFGTKDGSEWKRGTSEILNGVIITIILIGHIIIFFFVSHDYHNEKSMEATMPANAGVQKPSEDHDQDEISKSNFHGPGGEGETETNFASTSLEAKFKRKYLLFGITCAIGAGIVLIGLTYEFYEFIRIEKLQTKHIPYCSSGATDTERNKSFNKCKTNSSNATGHADKAEGNCRNHITRSCHFRISKMVLLVALSLLLLASATLTIFYFIRPQLTRPIYFIGVATKPSKMLRYEGKYGNPRGHYAPHYPPAYLSVENNHPITQETKERYQKVNNLNIIL